MTFTEQTRILPSGPAGAETTENSAKKAEIEENLGLLTAIYDSLSKLNTNMRKLNYLADKKFRESKNGQNQ